MFISGIQYFSARLFRDFGLGITGEPLGWRFCRCLQSPCRDPGAECIVGSGAKPKKLSKIYPILHFTHTFLQGFKISGKESIFPKFQQNPLYSLQRLKGIINI